MRRLFFLFLNELAGIGLVLMDAYKKELNNNCDRVFE
jgi:hypothetical protein